jgi:phage/plasmid-associated DNA primase
MEYLDKGKLTPPQRVIDETEEYRKDNDRLGVFIEDNVIRQPGHQVDMAEVYRRYQAWSRDRGEMMPMSGQAFTTRMKDRSDVDVYTVPGSRQSYLTDAALKDLIHIDWTGGS